MDRFKDTMIWVRALSPDDADVIEEHIREIQRDRMVHDDKLRDTFSRRVTEQDASLA